MSKINLMFIVFISLWFQNSWANSSKSEIHKIFYKNNFLEVQINYDKSADIRKVKNSLKLIKEATLNSYILNNLDSLSVEINIEKKSKKISTSNAEKNCKIKLNYEPSLKGVLINSFEEDLLFTYFHEISHCLLGKEIFRNGIKWNKSLSLSDETISKANEQIELLTDLTTVKDQCVKNCITVNIFDKPPPLVIYHEIFADTMGISLYQRYNCETAKKIFKEIQYVRFDKYAKNKIKSMHQSFRAFYYLNMIDLCDKEVDFKEISFYTQKGILDYLNDLD